MSNIKITISVQKSLFEQAEKIAREMKVSRSHLFTLALEEFIQHYRNGQLLEQINATYSDQPDPEEQLQQQKMRRIQKRLLKDDEWK